MLEINELINDNFPLWIEIISQIRKYDSHCGYDLIDIEEKMNKILEKSK